MRKSKVEGLEKLKGAECKQRPLLAAASCSVYPSAGHVGKPAARTLPSQDFTSLLS